ncbi:hypothetical protein LG299_12225 [Microbacterium lacus]|uniref:hypothetical protein n=1 Tax=Microbacterium lacus TaxID=415217 RepID=UPI00384C576A
MSEFDTPDPKGVSRRTVTKAMAWSLPVIAVATTAPGAAASIPPPPPPPDFNFADACATVGNTNNGCADLARTSQVPFTVTNPAGNGDLLFQITAMNVVNGNVPGIPQNNSFGVHGIYLQNAAGSDNEFSGLCPGPNVALPPSLLCPNMANPTANVLVQDGQTLNLWVVAGDENNNSSSFTTYLAYQWVDPNNACAVVPREPGDPGYLVEYAEPSGNCQ